MLHASSRIVDINVTYSLFSTPFIILKNIIFFIVVLSLLSCQTHPFSPKYFFFQMALFIIVVRTGVPMGLLVIKDPYIWLYE
jgi:hypothetical protein